MKRIRELRKTKAELPDKIQSWLGGQSEDPLRPILIEAISQMASLELTVAEMAAVFPRFTKLPKSPGLRRVVLLLEACGDDLELYKISKIVQAILHLNPRTAQDIIMQARSYLAEKSDYIALDGFMDP